MKTTFYKILYNGEEVVYVGVTTRTINERFKEHVLSKFLNLDDFSVVEFVCVEHPPFDSLNTFLEERKKIVGLERKYIQEEKDKGSKLLNASKGGEWGAHIYNKLLKEEFLKEFGSYDDFAEYRMKQKLVKTWVGNWISHKSTNKVKTWVGHWIYCRSENKVKRWVGNWITNRKVIKL